MFVVSDLEETTGVVLLDDFQTVLHQACGLTQLHRTVGDLIPNNLEKKKKRSKRRVKRGKKEKRRLKNRRRKSSGIQVLQV